MKDVCTKIPTSQQEMLEDMLRYYTEDPDNRRSVAKGAMTGKLCVESCFYHPDNAHKPKSQGCAIGRYLKDASARFLDKDGGSAINNILTKSEKRNKLPAWMRKLNIKAVVETDLKEIGLTCPTFLQQLQLLHDTSIYWSKEGLSEKGKTHVAKMCTAFNLTYPTFI